MTNNKLLKSINTQLLKNPSLSDADEALKTLKEYVETRKFVENVFTSYGYSTETRWKEVEQYFVIRRLLEVSGIRFLPTKTDNQSEAVKYFNLDWKGNKTARLYWSIGNGWSVEHKSFNRELTGVWEGFSLEDELENNQIEFE